MAEFTSLTTLLADKGVDFESERPRNETQKWGSWNADDDVGAGLRRVRVQARREHFGTIDPKHSWFGETFSDDEGDEQSVLDDAIEVVEERENVHGSPKETHRRIARMWEAYLDLPEGTIKSHDAAVMLGHLKDARIRENPTRRENWVDKGGYTDCGWRSVDERGESDE